LLGGRIEGARRALAELEPGEWVAHVLEESPDGRAVVSFEHASRRLIGKVRADGGGARAYELLGALSRTRCATLQVARPVAWFPEHGALITEVAAGTACRTLDLAADGGAIARIARALSELHSVVLPPGVTLPGPKSLADHVAELMQPAPWVLARRFPVHAHAISHTLAQLTAEEASWGVTPVSVLHRDFHLRQLFDDGTRITVLDWDDAALGDPAFDVGYFTAYLRTHYAADDAEVGIAAFRASYGGALGLWERVPAYERFNYLRRACRRLRMRDPGWREAIEAMLLRLVA
jgi:aminoglycoside phosphotransferase (APT) family kinase protein